MNTKRSLLTSCTALLLCFVMLLGTTYAWFTDTVTSSGNKIQSGSLKLDLLVLKEGSTDDWYSIKEESDPLFTYEQWEPGYTDVTILKVENLGNLSLKWVAKFASETPLSDLAKVIDVYVLPGATEYPSDRATLEGWNKVGTLDNFINSISTTTYGYLDAYASATLGIALKMQEDAGNEYMDLTLGAFDIRIVATQADAESDSFGNDYDDGAQYPDPNGFSASATVADSDLTYGALNSPITIGDANGINATLPAGVKLADGASSVKLTVKSADTDSNIALGEGESALSLDVHIDGIAADNAQPMIVNLGAILQSGLSDTEVKLFHIENGVTVAMTRVASAADFNANNQYTYDSATGEVSIYVKSFSVFSAIKTSADVWDGTSDTNWYNEIDTEFTLTTAEQFAGFRDLVDGGNTFEGKTVTLGTDIDLNNILFNPIGYGYYDTSKRTEEDGVVTDTNTVFMGTFDGANHTVYGLYQQGWDLEAATEGQDYTYSTAGAGLFASIKNATIKNLAVSGANIVMECVDMGIVVGYAQGTCYFENIVVTNSKIANYQRYTGGVVGEVSYGVNDDNGYSHTFKNITVDSSVKISSLWGDFDNACGGVIGGKWGDANVLMQNVTVAAEIDAFSDVTAAYQWYAYRRCGMLIGHTEQNSPKKALNAAAEFLTCENVNVYYGDWVNYTYYQFTDQDNSWCNNYPWVRAEEGEHNSAFSNPRYGVPVINGETVTEDNAGSLAKSKVTITFNQLYGGGQGVYGAADHEGVTVHNSLSKTIYINNNLNWNNLTLDYWFANGDDRWSTIVDGASIELATGTVYKVDLPAYANGFKIAGTDANGVTVSTPEILLSNVGNVGESYTYPISAFSYTLSVGTNSLDVTAGNLLYNTQVYNGKVPDASKYDVLVYDKDYTGTIDMNGFGVAIVLDANGKIVRIYDGANDGQTAAYYTYTTEGKQSHATLTTANYASIAWSERQTGETLLVFPNDGAGNYERNWAQGLIALVGQNMTVTTTVHVCENVCDTCGKCTDWNCYNCRDYVCKCLTISVNGNQFTATEGKWAYNSTNINSTTAKNYQMIVFDKDYQGTFFTNANGVAIVLDETGKLTRIYDAANLTYYTESGKQSTVPFTVSNFAVYAFAKLQEGEKLVIFPYDGSTSASRTWALGLRTDGSIGETATLETTAGFSKTIYFQNNYKWSNIKAYYWYAPEYMWHLETAYPGVSVSYVTFDGENDIYRVDVPYYATGLIINGTDTNKGSLKTEDVDITTVDNGKICSITENENETDGIVKAYWYGNSIDYSVLYLKPNSDWKTDSARFSAYCWYLTGSTKYEEWFSMTDHDGDGVYSCWIPTKYVNVIFCRMNPSNSTNSWDYKWNQTGDLTVPTNGNNLFTISQWDDQTTGWSVK